MKVPCPVERPIHLNKKEKKDSVKSKKLYLTESFFIFYNDITPNVFKIELIKIASKNRGAIYLIIII